jgi:hypothetical protein
MLKLKSGGIYFDNWSNIMQVLHHRHLKMPPNIANFMPIITSLRGDSVEGALWLLCAKFTNAYT